MTLGHRRSRTRWDLYGDPALSDLTQHDTPGWYLGMLLDDLGNRHYAYDCHLSIDSDDPRAAEDFVSAFLIDMNHRGRDRAEYQFWSLVESVAFETFMHGRTISEVFLVPKDHDGVSAEWPAGPRLDILPGWSLKARRKSLWQIDSSEPRGWRSLHNSTLVEFKLDPPLAEILAKTRQDLEALDRSRFERQVEMATNSGQYDITLHQRRLHELAARATSGVGWDGRGLFMERATDSLRMYRRLRFLKTWLAIVELTQRTLNGALRLADDESAPRSLSIEGLPRPDEIEDAMRAVRKGTESLDAIRNRLLHPKYA